MSRRPALVRRGAAATRLDAQLEQQTPPGRPLRGADRRALADAATSKAVEALTRALESAVLEGPALEQRRAGAAADLAAALGLDPARASTLSELVRSLRRRRSPRLLARRAEALQRSRRAPAPRERRQPRPDRGRAARRSTASCAPPAGPSGRPTPTPGRTTSACAPSWTRGPDP